MFRALVIAVFPFSIRVTGILERIKVGFVIRLDIRLLIKVGVRLFIGWKAGMEKGVGYLNPRL